MSMEVTNNYGGYATGIYDTTVKKHTATKRDGIEIQGFAVKINADGSMQCSCSGSTRSSNTNKNSSILNMNDRTKESNLSDYSKYLQGKYSYMNTGGTSMQGVPTTVSVSSAFLQKCMNDPEKAKYLEENLAAIPDCVKSLCNAVKMAPGSPVVTYVAYTFDDNGNISVTSCSTNDPDGKIAKENAERKAKEKKATEEKAAKRRAEKKAEQEILAEKRAEKKAAQEARTETPNDTVRATGTDVKTATQRVIAASLGVSMAIGESFDIKA